MRWSAGHASGHPRARMLPLDPALDDALDRYTFMRDAYLQHRDAQVHGTRTVAEDAPSTDSAESVGAIAPEEQE